MTRFLSFVLVALAAAVPAQAFTTKTWNGASYSIPEAGDRNWGSLTNFLTALADNAQTTSWQKVGVRVATSTPVTVASATDYAVVTNMSVASAVTVNLPAGANGRTYVIVDGKGDAASNNVTIDGSGSETINGSATYVINVNRAGVALAWNGSSWTVVAEQVGMAAGSGVIARAKVAAGTASHVLINDGSGNLSSEATLAKSRGGAGADMSSVTFPSSGVLVTEGATQTLTAKTLTTPTITGATLSLDDTDTANTLSVASTSTLTSGRTLTFDVDDAARTVRLGGNLTLAADLITSGANSLTLTTTGASNVTLPTTGTLATLAGSETLSSKVLTSPTVRNELLLQNASGNQPELHFSEDPDNGTNKVVVKALATLGADLTLTLPPDDGDSGEVLSTNGSGVLDWVAPLTNPMDSAGDLIVGGASGAATKLDSGTSGGFLLSAGAGAPTWSFIMDSAGDMVVGGASGVPTKLNSGTSTTVLRSNGAAAPTWEALGTITTASLSNNSVADAVSGSYGNVVLNKGKYIITGKAEVSLTSGTAWVEFDVSISTANNTVHTPSSVRLVGESTASTARLGTTRILDITADGTPVYLVVYADYNASSATFIAADSNLTAIKVGFTD